MDKPAGGMTRQECQSYAKNNSRDTIFLVYGGWPEPTGMVTHPAHWYAFNMDPPSYYFTNYLLAYGYMLRIKDAQTKKR